MLLTLPQDHNVASYIIGPAPVYDPGIALQSRVSGRPSPSQYTAELHSAACLVPTSSWIEREMAVKVWEISRNCFVGRKGFDFEEAGREDRRKSVQQLLIVGERQEKLPKIQASGEGLNSAFDGGRGYASSSPTLRGVYGKESFYVTYAQKHPWERGFRRKFHDFSSCLTLMLVVSPCRRWIRQKYHPCQPCHYRA
jgi:hypothetical protein